MNDTTTQAIRRSILAALKTSDLDTGKMKLFKTNVVINNQTVAGDLTICDFTGYVDVTTTAWTTPLTTPDGEAHVSSGTCEFASTGPAVPNTCYGWYFLSKGAGTPLILAGNFDPPINFGDVGDGIVFVIDLASNEVVTPYIIEA